MTGTTQLPAPSNALTAIPTGSGTPETATPPRSGPPDELFTGRDISRELSDNLIREMMAEDDLHFIAAMRFAADAAADGRRRLIDQCGHELREQLETAMPLPPRRRAVRGESRTFQVPVMRPHTNLINEWGTWVPHDRRDLRQYVMPGIPGDCYALPVLLRQRSLWTMVLVLRDATYGTRKLAQVACFSVLREVHL
jgi:hypothetical protein